MKKFTGRIFATAAIIGQLYLAGGSTASAATLLPNGEQLFTDNNGLPLSAGCVYFFIPGTTNPKATYQNSGQTVANTNPVQLDAAGRAIIYGTGTYRQVVRASGGGISPCSPAGDQIWDQLTASTDSSATIFAGASAGTPNTITVNAPAFSGTDGQVINYISTNTNTGGATFNPSGFGAIQIVRDSATGPAPLTGGELVATNAVSLLYDATAGTFHILSPVTWPNSSGVPVGTIIPVAGFSAPANYAFTYGQAVNRTSFSGLFGALTLAQSGSISSGNPTITGLADTSQIGVLKPVEAVGIPAGARILSCTSSTCTMDTNANTTRTGTMTFFAYENGDGSTTFNLPNLNGRGLVGRDNTGGTASNVVQVATNLTTTATSATATVASASGLAIGMYLTGNANVASGTKISAISGTTITLSTPATGTQSGVATRYSVFPDAQGLGVAGGGQVVTLLPTNVPSITSLNPSQSISVNSGSKFVISDNTGAIFDFPSTVGSGLRAGDATSSAAQLVSTGSNSISVTSSGTNSTPVANIPPASIINWAIRLVP